MKELSEYLSEDIINNIYDRHKNVFVVTYNEDAVIGNDYAGELLLKVNIEKDKPYIKINDHVRFKRDRIKWKNQQKNICVVDPYWVKLFIDDEKLPVQVKVLRSKVIKDKREYYKDYETIKMNYKQFISRRLFEEFHNLKYSYMESYSNFQKRRKKVGYYQALNETSKHYLIEHNDLKTIVIPKVNNALKRFKKEWDVLYVQDIKNAKAKKAIDKLIKIKRSKSADIIPMRKVKDD